MLVGLVGTVLAWAADYAGGFFSGAVKDWPWLPFLVTPLGLLVIAFLTRRYFPAAEGSGIPQAIAMLEVRDPVRRREVLGLGVGIFKAFMVVLGLACGASIGREGPTVHIAAAISYSLSRFAHFPYYIRTRGLILAGAAAGLSAAFNTPLAGVVFAIEEMSRSFLSRTNGFILAAVVLSGITSLSIQGNYSYFGTVGVQLDILDALGAIVVCGVLGGLLGGIFSSMLIQGASRLGGMRSRFPYRFALACGFLLALIGLLSGGMTYGTGYDQAREALTTGHGDGLLYPMLKLLATVVSYLSGIPGGIFAPALSTGANLGAELAPLIPSAPANAVALLGMVAYFTGVVQSPITAVIIVMEMTDEPELLVSLMTTALLAQWVSRHVCPNPLYHVLAQDFLKSDTTKNKMEHANP